MQVVQGHTCAGDRLKLGAVELLFHAEVAILDVVFLKAFVVGGNHAGAGHKEARHKADGGDEQNGDDRRTCPSRCAVRAACVCLKGPSRASPLYHSRSCAGTLTALVSLLRMAPSRRRTTRSAIRRMASLWVTMMTVLPYFWLTVSMSFSISLHGLDSPARRWAHRKAGCPDS